jgi:hypothetical protein
MRFNSHTQEVQIGQNGSYTLKENILLCSHVVYGVYTIYYSCISNIICASISSSTGVDINIPHPLLQKSCNLSNRGMAIVAIVLVFASPSQPTLLTYLAASLEFS